MEKSARSDLHHMSLTASCPPFLSTHQGCIQCRVSFSEHSISYANDAFDFTAGFIFRTTLEVSIATVYLSNFVAHAYFALGKSNNITSNVMNIFLLEKNPFLVASQFAI